MHRTGLFRRCDQTSDGPLGLGTTYFDATRMGTFRGEVTDYQPPSRIGFRETLRWFGFDMTGSRCAHAWWPPYRVAWGAEYFLEADREGTIVHHVAEGDLFGLMRMMKPA